MRTVSNRRTAVLLTWTLAVFAIACGSASALPVTESTADAGNPGDTPISVVDETEGRIWLEAPTGDFQTGWATLFEENGNLKVDITVTPPEAVAQPAHIHLGTCDNLGVVVHSLENIIGGHSLTDIPDSSIEDVATGGMAINLHLSFSNFALFTACGEIPELP
jgi:hypothetical protein